MKISIRALCISTCLLLTQVVLDSALAGQDATLSLHKSLAADPERAGKILLEEFEKSAGQIPVLKFRATNITREDAALVPDFEQRKSILISLPIEGIEHVSSTRSTLNPELFNIVRKISDEGPLLGGIVAGIPYMNGNPSMEQRASSTGLVFSSPHWGYELRQHRSSLLMVAVLPDSQGNCQGGRPATKYCSVGYVW